MQLELKVKQKTESKTELAVGIERDRDRQKETHRETETESSVHFRAAKSLAKRQDYIHADYHYIFALLDWAYYCAKIMLSQLKL